MPQTSIPDTMDKAYAGQLAEAYAPRFARLGVTEGAGCSAGMPVKRGTDQQAQIVPFGGADVPDAQIFAGVVILDTSRAYTTSGGLDSATSVDVLRLGSIYMDFSEPVTSGEQVHITLATGALKGVAQGTAAAVGDALLPGLRIAETISAAGLATVEVNLFGV